MHHSHRQLSAPIQVHTDSEGHQQMLYSQLAQSQADIQFYQQKYHEMKSINHSIIAAIKRVYSQQVGEALELLIKQEQAVSDSTHAFPDQAYLTNTFCQKMLTYSSNLISQQSIDQLPPRPFTPQKTENESYSSQIINARNQPLSPLASKNNAQISQLDQSFNKWGLEDASTRRTYTPIRTTIATQILCELCDRVFLPNQFVCHAQRCKFKQLPIEIETDRSQIKQMKNSNVEFNYGKMMKNLLKIRQQIEQQIKLVMASKQQVDRADIRKTLQQDLKRVIKVMHEKEEEVKKKKHHQSRCVVPSKKGHKLR